MVVRVRESYKKNLGMGVVVRSKEVFKKILTMGEWAPLPPCRSSATPLPPSSALHGAINAGSLQARELLHAVRELICPQLIRWLTCPQLFPESEVSL